VTRVLYLCADPGIPVLGHKGASVHVRALATALASAGASVVLASPRTEPEGEALDEGIELVPVDPVLPKSCRTAAELRRAIARQGAQIREVATRHAVAAIYERYSLFSDGGVRTAAVLGLRHALEVNAPLREEARRFRTLPYPELAAALERDVFAGTDRIFAVSETLGEIVRSEGGAGKVEIVPNAIDPTGFGTPREARGTEFTIGFAGSLKPWHGVEVLLEAFGRAHAVAPELRLEIVGDGPERAAVERAQLPVGAMRYLGHLPHADTVRAMARWDVGAAPYLPMSRFYFSPLKLVEYMAAGVCPVASDNNELRALLDHGQRGVLVEPGSVDELAHAFVELAREPARAVAIAARAQAYALGSLSWLAVAERVLAVLDDGREERVA
jgi:glycosyltransferase involved in cell wall biosynthesis